MQFAHITNLISTDNYFRKAEWKVVAISETKVCSWVSRHRYKWLPAWRPIHFRLTKYEHSMEKSNGWDTFVLQTRSFQIMVGLDVIYIGLWPKRSFVSHTCMTPLHNNVACNHFASPGNQDIFYIMFINVNSIHSMWGTSTWRQSKCYYDLPWRIAQKGLIRTVTR